MIDVEVPMDVLSDSIKLHGMQIKKAVCAEEMSELIKEICWVDYKTERQVKRDWEYARNKNRG